MPAVVVYFQGRSGVNELWYRVEFDTSAHGESRRIEIGDPVATLHPSRRSGKAGKWAVLGEDDIYWVGGFNHTARGETCPCMNLLKHNCSGRNPKWEVVSSANNNIPRTEPFVAAVGGKLCVVSGYDNLPEKPHGSYADAWSKAGEIYDPGTNSWSYLEAPIQFFHRYDPLRAAVHLTEEESKDEIVFFNLYDGSMLLYNLTSPELNHADHLPSFALWCYDRYCRPKALKACHDLTTLCHVTINTRPVFKDYTFYWFTTDLFLCAYDTKLQKWLFSPSLAHVFQSLELMSGLFLLPSLVGLPNGKLLVIVQEGPQNLTMACLAVSRGTVGNSLCVFVEYFQSFSVDDTSFLLHNAQAMLKNT